jgi:hypothetical protein
MNHLLKEVGDWHQGHALRRSRANSRSIFRIPPLKAFRATVALPSDDFGPVDFSQGFHLWINFARSRRCSGVR